MNYFLDLSDKRNVVAKDLLEKTGCEVFAYNNETKYNIVKGDAIVFSPAKSFSNEEVESFPSNITIFCGNISQEIENLFENKKIAHRNFMSDEIFTMKNAMLTSEGVLALILANSDKSVFDNNVLILGGGRIAKSLAVLFGKLGIKFGMVSFNPVKFPEYSIYTDRCYYKYEFLTDLHEYDIVVNTIPKKFIEDEMLDKFAINTLFIETASIDCLNKDKVKNFKFLPAPRLPQVFSAYSAGKEVFKSILGVNKYE